MGSACASGTFDSDTFYREYDRVSQFCEQLEITESEVKKFYAIFEAMDDNMSGKINLDEFFEHFEIEYSRFAGRAFAAMDIPDGSEKDKKLSFDEFFVGCWNYCTMDHGMLVKFAFEMFDRDGSGEIDRKELTDIVAQVMPKRKKKRNKDVQKLLVKNDNGDGVITLDEWRQMERGCVALLRPAFDVQKRLTEMVLGPAYWGKAKQKRKRLVNNQDLLHVQQKLLLPTLIMN